MNRPLTYLLYVILTTVLATVVGCQKGDTPTYANVSGTVTFNNKPIEKGQITFAMEGRPPSTSDIVDGKFSGQAMVGSNKVSISARKKTTAAPPKAAGGAAAEKDKDAQIKGYQEKFKGAAGEFGGPPKDYDPSMVEYIPAEWNTSSTQMRVVDAGAANNFQFDIKGPN